MRDCSTTFPILELSFVKFNDTEIVLDDDLRMLMMAMPGETVMEWQQRARA